jgi:hypothetical protein
MARQVSALAACKRNTIPEDEEATVAIDVAEHAGGVAGDLAPHAYVLPTLRSS